MFKILIAFILLSAPASAQIFNTTIYDIVHDIATIQQVTRSVFAPEINYRELSAQRITPELDTSWRIQSGLIQHNGVNYKIQGQGVLNQWSLTVFNLNRESCQIISQIDFGTGVLAMNINKDNRCQDNNQVTLHLL